jgi:hypothetical protein
MTKTEKEIIENVIRRLRGQGCSPEVKAALTGPAGLYLETWVISALEIMVSEKRDMKLAADLCHVPYSQREDN